MLQQDEPDDYVIATGEMHSVRELCEVAFGLAGLDWERTSGSTAYFRPTEVDELCGDASKAANGSAGPRRTLRELVRIMLEHDLREARSIQRALGAGHDGSAVNLRNEPLSTPSTCSPWRSCPPSGGAQVVCSR